MDNISIELPYNQSSHVENYELNCLCSIQSHENSIKNESFMETPGILFCESSEIRELHKIKPKQVNASGDILRSMLEDLISKEPLPAEITESCIPAINIVTTESNLTLEHSEALKEFSSIIPSPVSEKDDDISSLEHDLNIKCRNSSNTEFPTTSRQIFDHDSSPSNPFSVTAEEKSFDNSGENIVTERTLSLLELIIYHEILDENIIIFQDTEYTIKFIDDYLIKLIASYISETLRPKVILNPSGKNNCNDADAMLTYVDKLFLLALENPENIKERILLAKSPLAVLNKIQNDVHTYYDEDELMFEDAFEDNFQEVTNGYEQIHNKMIILASSQAFLKEIDKKIINVLEFGAENLEKLKLSDLLVEVRGVICK